MRRKSLLQQGERGSVLALVMIAVVLLFVSGMGTLSIGLAARLFSVRQSDEIAAQVAADAGLTMAVWTLNRNVQTKYSAQDLPALTNQTLANCSATFSYEVTVPTGSFFQALGAGGDQEVIDAFTAKLPFAYRYLIKSVGKSGNAEKVLYATVRLRGLFESALFSKGQIDFMANTLVTGYNSADPTDTEIDVKIGTLSIEAERIYLGPGTVVDADVFVGVGGDPDEVLDLFGTITGQKFALTETIQFPVITAPALPYIGTSIIAKGITVKLYPADSGTYKEIKLSTKANEPGVLEINGDVILHLAGDIELGNNTDIIIKNGSSLALYTDGDIAMDNSAGFANENSSPSTLKIFSTGEGIQSFDLKAKSETFGVVYASNADVELYPKAELHGAIVARNISMLSRCIFKYDEALRDVSPDDEGARFVIEKWWE